ncbi:hypothetical protein GCM10009759_64800 [Kitasatospora saccharophila]|uniref:Uncharacterized protein n=1 Tax=Kitasatospora saccharophila TaxID=407973 RepID=A0ABN2XW59_9ACTN
MAGVAATRVSPGADSATTPTRWGGRAEESYPDIARSLSSEEVVPDVFRDRRGTTSLDRRNLDSRPPPAERGER